MMNKNLEIYEAGRAVPDEAQKSFNNGSFSGTDINPMWRIKKLTELFGPCGVGWYYDVTSERSEEIGDMVMAIVDLKLFVKVNGEWSKPIYGTGGNKLKTVTKSGARTSDEGYKMALTDALSVACKALGIGADVYFSQDRTKYTADYAKEIGGTPAAREPEQKAEPKPVVQAAVSITPICEQCGREIRQTAGKNNTIWAPNRIAEYTRQKCGKAVCFDCFNIWKAANM